MYIQQQEIAEEIVSDTFVKCWNNRANMHDVRLPDTYLFVAVKNQVLNYRKKYSRIHLVQLDDSEQAQLLDAVTPQSQLEKKELALHLEGAIEALPFQCQVIFRLIKEDGLKYREVAEILNVSPGTIRTQMFRAMRKLNVSMAGYLNNSSTIKVYKDDIILNIIIVLLSAKLFF